MGASASWDHTPKGVVLPAGRRFTCDASCCAMLQWSIPAEANRLGETAVEQGNPRGGSYIAFADGALHDQVLTSDQKWVQDFPRLGDNKRIRSICFVYNPFSEIFRPDGSDLFNEVRDRHNVLCGRDTKESIPQQLNSCCPRSHVKVGRVGLREPRSGELSGKRVLAVGQPEVQIKTPRALFELGVFLDNLLSCLEGPILA
jgi:hypothetical protein